MASVLLGGGGDVFIDNSSIVTDSSSLRLLYTAVHRIHKTYRHVLIISYNNYSLYGPVSLNACMFMR